MARVEGQEDGNNFGVLGQAIPTPNMFGEAPPKEFGVWGVVATTSGDIGKMRLELGSLGELIQPLDPVLNVGNQGSVPTAGVFGVSFLGLNTAGVVGESDGLGGVGVFGISYLGHGVRGKNGAGVAGYEPADPGIGVWGESDNNTGVFGHSNNGRGVWGVSDNFIATVGDSTNGTGVWGHSINGVGVYGEGVQYGVHGKSNRGSAVFGENTESGDGVTGRSGNGTGVAGVSERGVGIYGRSESLEFGKAGYFEGNVTVTGDICLVNADCAEDFDVLDIAEATPGTVMVLNECGAVRASDRPYDTRVAGVVSGAGGLRPGIILDRGAPAQNRQPLALMGKVYCKVDARYGAIVVGDLLTTSATPGHAMKASDRTKAFGAVIGKSLEALNQGTALIAILVGLR